MISIYSQSRATGSRRGCVSYSFFSLVSYSFFLLSRMATGRIDQSRISKKSLRYQTYNTHGLKAGRNWALVCGLCYSDGYQQSEVKEYHKHILTDLELDGEMAEQDADCVSVSIYQQSRKIEHSITTHIGIWRNGGWPEGLPLAVTLYCRYQQWSQKLSWTYTHELELGWE